METASILGVSRKTIFQWARDGKIDATKVGRNYVIPHASVLGMLGVTVGKDGKVAIEKAVDKALKEYEKTFRLLGRE